ncbi:gp070 [Rhodococcus phage ReqiPepy6]|uniref:Gp070 n=1 Tax=Rhodococcus phage ReqiPepy6 TaxID=691965 RepID=D4P7I1_9CAUD|nr:gp070 [Rhodococcus phage ReqiPepy6]ADD80961.1 gp070 [Rhodococcus phage ReqiPepy6]
MNSNTGIVVASSLASCAVGAGAAYFLTKKYVTTQYETLMEEEVEKAKLYYSQLYKTGEFSDLEKLAKERLGSDDSDDISDEETSEEESDATDDEDAAEVTLSERVEITREERVNYNNIQRNYVGDDSVPERHIPNRDFPRPVSHPEDGESMESFEKRLIQQASDEVKEKAERAGEEELVRHNIFDTHGRHPDTEELDTSMRGNGDPYILSRQEFEDCDLDYDQNTLTYYEGDNVLTDERNVPINNGVISIIGGEQNLRFGHWSDDANVLYIRNDRLSVDFEIVRSMGTYAEEVLGYTQGE